MVTETVEKILAKESQADNNLAQAKAKAKEIAADSKVLAEEKYDSVIQSAKKQAEEIIENAQNAADEKIKEAQAQALVNKDQINKDAAPKENDAIETVKNVLFG
jgi:vacuolar-type H+-ATPase subunit H